MGNPDTDSINDYDGERAPTGMEIDDAVAHFDRQMFPHYAVIRDVKGRIHDSFFTIKEILSQAEDRLNLGNHRDWDNALYAIQAVIDFEASKSDSRSEKEKSDVNDEGMVAQLVESVLLNATMAKDVSHSSFLRRLAFSRSYWSDDDVIEQMEIRLILVREILKSRGELGGNETLVEIGEALSTVLDEVTAIREQNNMKIPLQVSALLTKLGYY